MELENKDICKKCGGICCKKCGCDYYPADFKDLSFNALYEKLKEGNISVVASIEFEQLKTGKMFALPHLYLRARNIDRNIIDLFSLKKTCSLLTENGCTYSINERPSGGVNLIPRENFKCSPNEDPRIKVAEWDRYQKVLSKLVKRINGLSVEDQMKIDVENLFYDLINNNTDGVSKMELEDVCSMLPYLLESYPDEYNRANERSDSKVKKLYLK